MILTIECTSFVWEKKKSNFYLFLCEMFLAKVCFEKKIISRRIELEQIHEFHYCCFDQEFFIHRTYVSYSNTIVSFGNCKGFCNSSINLRKNWKKNFLPFEVPCLLKIEWTPLYLRHRKKTVQKITNPFQIRHTIWLMTPGAPLFYFYFT